MTDRIEREQLLPAPVSLLWELVTGPGWLADEVELELVPGGEARFSSQGCVKSGWVEEALAPASVDDGGSRGRRDRHSSMAGRGRHAHPRGAAP